MDFQNPPATPSIPAGPRLGRQPPRRSPSKRHGRWLEETYDHDAARVTGIEPTTRAIATGTALWVPNDLALKIVTAVLKSSLRPPTPDDRDRRTPAPRRAPAVRPSTLRLAAVAAHVGDAAKVVLRPLPQGRVGRSPRLERCTVSPPTRGGNLNDPDMRVSIGWALWWARSGGPSSGSPLLCGRGGHSDRTAKGDQAGASRQQYPVEGPTTNSCGVPTPIRHTAISWYSLIKPPRTAPPLDSGNRRCHGS